MEFDNDMDRGSEPISEQRPNRRSGNDNILYFPRRDPAGQAGDPGNAAWLDDPYQPGHRSLVVYRPDGTLKSELWFRADEVHRVDGPAFVRHNEDGSRIEHWYLAHRRHRTDGPAIVEWAKDGRVRAAQWWIAGRDVTETAQSFLAETEISWPLDEADEDTFLRRCVSELRHGQTRFEAMGWESIVTATCLASLFWLPVVVTVALLWA